MTSAQRFTLLSIGEGIVTQLPALLISTATAIIVTRAAAEGSLRRRRHQDSSISSRAS